MRLPLPCSFAGLHEGCRPPPSRRQGVALLRPHRLLHHAPERPLGRPHLARQYRHLDLLRQQQERHDLGEPCPRDPRARTLTTCRFADTCL